MSIISDQKIYVTGIPLGTPRQEVRNLFSKFGAIRSLFLTFNKYYKYAFIAYHDSKSVEAALNYRAPLMILNKRIYVKQRIQKLVSPPPAEPQTQTAKEQLVHNGLTKIEKVNINNDVTSEYTDNSAGDVQTLMYGTNGELRFGVGIRAASIIESSRVIRVDGIYTDWLAKDLFNHLYGIGVPVTATMVYDDYDERGIRQGLVQLQSSKDAAKLCEKSFLRTPMLYLSILPSTVNSIGPVRRTYRGKFTSYSTQDIQTGNKKVQQQERINDKPINPKLPHRGYANYGYSVGEPHVPNPNTSGVWSPPMEWSPGISPAISANAVSPSSLASPVSVESHCETSLSPKLRLTQQTMTIDPYVASQQNITSTEKTTCCHNSYETTFLPIKLPQKPSQTVVVDNFDSNVVFDAQTLAISMSQFGKVLIVDLVPLGNQLARAYIMFEKSINAEMALGKLSMYSSGQQKLCVHLA